MKKNVRQVSWKAHLGVGVDFYCMIVVSTVPIVATKGERHNIRYNIIGGIIK